MASRTWLSDYERHIAWWKTDSCSSCPSIGLMDQPQDAYHYSWHLIDRKDSPFVTFRFHYRSWDSLEQLNLIPSKEFEFVRSISTATLGRNRSTTMESTEDIQRQMDDSQVILVTDDGHGGDESIFEGSRTQGGNRRDQTNYSLGSPPIVFPLSSRSDSIPQPSKALRDAYRDSYLQRPLPELPQHEEPSVISRRSSSSSSTVASVCPSLTPSLKQSVDDGAFDDDDTFEIGVARTVTLSRPPKSPGTPNKKNNTTKSETLEDHSMSDYATSPASTSEYHPNKALSPGRYLPTTGSSFELGLECFTLSPREDFTPAPLASQAQTELVRKMSGTQQQPQQGLPPYYRSEQDLSQVTRLKLSESEWMSRTPSPAEREHANTARRLWSPPPSNLARSGGGRFLDFRRKKSSESLEKEEVRVGMVGNWI